jgi:hypothetical protein
MRLLLAGAACVAFSVAAVHESAAQGPIREGLRRTGEIAVEGTRGAAQGAANVARGVGQATAGAVGRTGQAAGNIVGGTAQALRGGVDRLTPNVPMQAQAGSNLAGVNQSRNARWRFARQNGEWWYYTPQNTWMYHRNGQWQQFSQDTFTPLNQGQQFNQGQQYAQGQPQPQGQQYSSGYRGVQSGQFQPMQQQVRTDAYGRQFICENGRPVYLDQGQAQFQGQQFQGQQQQGQLSPTPASPEQPQEHSVARQNLDQSTTAGAIEQQNQSIQSSGAQSQNLDATGTESLQSDQSGGDPATPAPASAAGSTDADVSRAPSGTAEHIDSTTQGSPASPREINNNPAPATHGATEQ